MLTARNVIVAIFTVAAVSLVAGLIQLAMPPDSGGRGGDSYGTRACGFRALYELMNELGAPAKRGLAPPSAFAAKGACLAFIDPDPDLISLDPDYLRQVAKRVRAGGFALVAPPVAARHEHTAAFQ
jgi:hypothetical protein